MIKEIENASLLGRNSFGIDAKASRLVEFGNAAELAAYLAARGHADESTAVIGGGNNILFTEDFRGTLLHCVGTDFAITGNTKNKVIVRAEAGLDWDDFVNRCINLGLWGAENLSAIPGTVGAAPVQNIGAYGAEAGDIIHSVELLDMTTHKESVLAAEHCCFGYRDSIFKHALKGRVVICAVNFALSREPSPILGYGALEHETAKLGSPTLENIRRAVTGIRSAKLPDPAVIGNAGSFFKNPLVPLRKAEELKDRFPEMPVYPGDTSEEVKIPAGWLIEKSGWKGASLGRAGVYEKQALILVNRGGATGKDIIALSEAITEDVASKFGIRIEPEVNIW